MSPGRIRKSVQYDRHERDRDGDLILYFQVRFRTSAPLLFQSSPITDIRSAGSAVIEQAAGGGEGKYIIATENTDYEVQIPHQVAMRIATSLLVARRCPA